MNSAEFESILTKRLEALFSDMAAGAGVSPSRRLRLEGYLQAGVELGLMSPQRAFRLVCFTFNAQFAENLSEDSPILGDASSHPIDIRIPLRLPVAGDADRKSKL